MFVFFAVAAAALGIAAGITAGKLLDKTLGGVSTLGGLLPDGKIDPFPPDSSGTLPVGKIIIFCVLGAIGVLIVKFVGKKLNVKFLK